MTSTAMRISSPKPHSMSRYTTLAMSEPLTFQPIQRPTPFQGDYKKAARDTLGREARYYAATHCFDIDSARRLAKQDLKARADARNQGLAHHREERLPLRYQLGAGFDRVSDACTRLTNTLNRGVASVVTPVVHFLGKAGNALRLAA